MERISVCAEGLGIYSTAQRMLDPGRTPSASRTARNILCRLASAKQSSINTGFRAQTSALRDPGGDPKFRLSGCLSPNLWTSPFGSRCRVAGKISDLPGPLRTVRASCPAYGSSIYQRVARPPRRFPSWRAPAADENAGEIPGGGITTHHDVGGVVLIKVGIGRRPRRQRLPPPAVPRSCARHGIIRAQAIVPHGPSRSCVDDSGTEYPLPSCLNIERSEGRP